MLMLRKLLPEVHYGAIYSIDALMISQRSYKVEREWWLWRSSSHSPGFVLLSCRPFTITFRWGSHHFIKISLLEVHYPQHGPGEEVGEIQ